MYLTESGVQLLISFVDWPMMKDCGENGTSYKGDQTSPISQCPAKGTIVADVWQRSLCLEPNVGNGQRAVSK